MTPLFTPSHPLLLPTVPVHPQRSRPCSVATAVTFAPWVSAAAFPSGQGGLRLCPRSPAGTQWIPVFIPIPHSRSPGDLQCRGRGVGRPGFTHGQNHYITLHYLIHNPSRCLRPPGSGTTKPSSGLWTWLLPGPQGRMLMWQAGPVLQSGSCWVMSCLPPFPQLPSTPRWGSALHVFRPQGASPIRGHGYSLDMMGNLRGK